MPFRRVERRVACLAVQVRQSQTFGQTGQIIDRQADVINAVLRACQLLRDFKHLIPRQLLARRILDTELIENIFVVIKHVLVRVERNRKYFAVVPEFFNVIP
ncbi:hypothetical protein D3C84_1135480 [compost metagenome]